MPLSSTSCALGCGSRGLLDLLDLYFFVPWEVGSAGAEALRFPFVAGFTGGMVRRTDVLNGTREARS